MWLPYSTTGLSSPRIEFTRRRAFQSEGDLSSNEWRRKILRLYLCDAVVKVRSRVTNLARGPSLECCRYLAAIPWPVRNVAPGRPRCSKTRVYGSALGGELVRGRSDSR